jgi:hypothetical protein
MKTLQTFTVFLALVIISPVSMGQGLLDAVKTTAEMHNDQKESEDPENGGEGNNDLTEEEKKKQEEMQKEFEKTMREYGEVIDEFNSPELRCMAMLIIYLYPYRALYDMTEEAVDCKRKYDLYGSQLLALTSGQTIMYCSENLALLVENDPDRFESLYEEFVEVIDKNINIPYDQLKRDFDYRTRANPRQSKTQKEIREEVIPDLKYNLYAKLLLKAWYITESMKQENPIGEGGVYSDYTENDNTIEFYINHFRPEYYIFRTLEIGRKMEALGCGG